MVEDPPRDLRHAIRSFEASPRGAARVLCVLGMRLNGKVNSFDATYVATVFRHFYWMPIIPLGSMLVVSQEGGRYHGIPLGLNLRSMLAGYLRSWGVVAAIAALITAIGSTASAATDPGTQLLLWMVAVACTGLSIWAWLSLGQLSAGAKRRQRAYHDFAGYPIDVAQMGEAREPMRAKLAHHVAERSPGLAPRGYRIEGSTGSSWQSLATNRSMLDTTFLRAALTLARIEWSFASGASRASFAKAHRVIWKKLRKLDPSVMQTEAAAAEVVRPSLPYSPRDTRFHDTPRLRHLGMALGVFCPGVLLGSFVTSLAPLNVENWRLFVGTRLVWQVGGALWCGWAIGWLNKGSIKAGLMGAYFFGLFTMLLCHAPLESVVRGPEHLSRATVVEFEDRDHRRRLHILGAPYGQEWEADWIEAVETCKKRGWKQEQPVDLTLLRGLERVIDFRCPVAGDAGVPQAPRSRAPGPR